MTTSRGIEELRHEVIEAQKLQSNFIKWKLILVSSLGSVSLGFYKSTIISHAEYLICVVHMLTWYTAI